MADRRRAARDAFARRAWADAYRHLAVGAQEDLEAADLELLASAAYLLGYDEASAAAWEAAHHRHLAGGEPGEAARCSFWLALCLMLRGQVAQAGGWLTRTEGIMRAAHADCAAVGYLLIPRLLVALDSDDASAAQELAQRAAVIGDRLQDSDLRAFAMLGQGQALIALGDTPGGMDRLDEVMVAVTVGEVGPITSGIVYCAVILECMQLFDYSRASEWTNALSAWCDAQPDLVPYRGQCLVHRSQLQQASGAWPDAVATVESARRRLTDPPHPALGSAHYQAAELHRLVGAFDEADVVYRQASRRGYQPMPGMALLELVRGEDSAAAASIRRALSETGNPGGRPALLIAAVDIFWATGDVAGVRAAAAELAVIAARYTSESLGAVAAQATGTLLLAEGDPSAALSHLRAAAAVWQHLQMPYEGARNAVLLGLACAALGDQMTAKLEFDAAHDTFTELGARPDLERLRSLTAALRAPTAQPHPVQSDPLLSPREGEVLALVAAGRMNREIAAELAISQHTVGRHVENIFAKLGVTSRAAATAYAYQHHLVQTASTGIEP